jgi:molybdopterin molybdotransferase
VIADLLSVGSQVLAESIVADRDFPPFSRAARDGYAVRSADVAEVPARLEIVGEIKAGDADDSLSVKAGQAAAIMTGAALPAGADAVVMVEYTAQSGNTVDVQRGVRAGENFVPRGAEARAGQTLLERGTRLDHAGIALAASVGKARLRVFRKPRVAVLATGDEIVAIDRTPGPSQIRNSNTYSLAAQIQDVGGEPVLLPIAPDERVRLRALIEEGLDSDLLLLAGGVSLGKYDLVEQVLGEMQAEFYFTGALIQPGKPIVFGSCRSRARAGAPSPHSTYFFGLPGNPVSTMVTFELFVRPMIQALAGGRIEALVFLKARLKSEIRTKIGLKRFLPAVVSGEFENAEVELARWQGSGDIAAQAAANSYLVIPPDREKIAAGEMVAVLMR